MPCNQAGLPTTLRNGFCFWHTPNTTCPVEIWMEPKNALDTPFATLLLENHCNNSIILHACKYLPTSHCTNALWTSNLAFPATIRKKIVDSVSLLHELPIV